MHRTTSPERAHSSLGKSIRSLSISSGVPSLQGHPTLSPPATINPEPAYIANSAASHLASAELEVDGVTLSSSALAQLNRFLDHILFSILLTAKSTRLSLLKPAIYSVLKPKLGRAALSGADDELREYVGEDEDEEESLEARIDHERRLDFDLELAWKLARLRCMVYSRLGDLEEDDEDEYIVRDNLDERGGRPRRYSSHPSRLTTASVIFLTSVIEFLAEQAVAHVAQATQKRLSRSQASPASPDPTALPFFLPDRIVVSDADMRQLGRDSPLQKLWRSWRHQVRLPTDSPSRNFSPASSMLAGNSRKASLSLSDDTPDSEANHQPSVAQVLHQSDPARIPLPMANNDVDDIEVPGLTAHHDRKDLENAVSTSDWDKPRGRPKSLELFPSAASPPTPTSPDAKIASAAHRARPAMSHMRSRSLPISPALTPYATPSEIPTHDWSAAELPMEGEELQQPSHTSRHLLGGEGVPGALSPALPLMPGTFPYGRSRREADIVVENMPLRWVEDGLQEPSDVASASAEPYLDGGEARKLTKSESIHESTTNDPVLSTRTYPPRNSSKASSEYSSDNQPRSPDPLGNIPSTSPTSAGRSGASPLAPLQEVVKNAREAPAQDFSGPASTEDHKRQGQVIFPSESREIGSRTSSRSSHHTKSSSSSSKLLGFDREQQSAMQVGSDRAGVQRIYPIAGAQESNGPFTPSSTSHSTKDKRPGTGSSHLSSLKRGNSAHASVDTALAGGKGHKSGVEQDVREQSLNNLIRSEETLKYTLTPQNMREMEAPGSPRQRTQTQDLADFFRDTAPPGHAALGEIESQPRSPVAGMNGLRANPPGPITIPPTHPAAIETSRPGRVEQQPKPSSAGRPARGQYRARDPKVETPSTRDLADFAKSTGPEDPGQLPKAFSGASARTPKRAKSAAPRFQPRDPIVKGGNSALIDFIREGPPRAKGDGAHRIPRTVAPFRTTMDSDELSALGPNHDPANRNSASSNQGDSIVTKSTGNSQTGLMDSTNRTALIPSNHSNLGASRFSKPHVEESTPPKRKQRRVRDPYAIDLGSDDEIDDGLGKPPKHEEESLIDFLRNSSPPPESQSQPQPLLLSTNRMGTPNSSVLRKPVNGGFRERLKRTASTNSLSRSGGANPSSLSSDRLGSSVRPGKQVRPSSPHLVQSGSRLDSYKPTETTYAAHVERNRQKAGSQTLDEGKDEGGLSKLFSRKRRIAT